MSAAGVANSQLPIHAYRSQLLESVANFDTTIVVGETGSGKSTQLPQFLVDTGLYNCVVCTQPRRVAAVTVAKRVAAERGGVIGNEVGYSIRFEDCTSSKTKLKFVTDGVLLREFMSDRQLNRYSVVILDEAHERSLQTDIIMGLLKQLQQMQQRQQRQGNKLKVIVMSATLDTELFSTFFGNSNVVNIPGRQYPVEMLYTKNEEKDIIEAMMLTCLQIHADEDDNGGVLLFLPGQDDIEALQQLLVENLPKIVSKLVTKAAQFQAALAKEAKKDGKSGSNKDTTSTMSSADFVIRPLYAAMPPEEQLKVFEAVPNHVRKFILSTNIAETSVTVPDVKYVVDCGFVKSRLIHPVTGYEMLKTIPISKAQANQRTGRAGRTGPGKCYRIYQEKVFNSFESVALPEIQRVNMTQVILQLKDLGISSILDFPLPSPPSTASIRIAFQILLMLQALDKTQNLTQHGKHMAQLPLFPVLAHLLLKSVEYGCVSEALTAVSILSSDNVFMQPFKEEDKQKAERARKLFTVKEGDLLTLVNVFERWKECGSDKAWATRNYLNQRSLNHALSVRTQLGTLLQSKLNIDITASCMPKKEPFLKCLAAGLFMNVARKVTAETSNAVESSAMTAKGPNGQPATNHGKYFEKVMSSMANNGRGDAQSAPYKTIRDGQFVHIHPSSVLFTTYGSISKLPNYIIFAELLVTSKQYVRTLSVIDESWLHLVAPHMFRPVVAAAASSSNAAGVARSNAPPASNKRKHNNI